MKRFYFYGAVTYPIKDFQEVPKGSIGLHYADGENEEEVKKEQEAKHNKQNIHFIDIFGKETKARFKWYGEINQI